MRGMMKMSGKTTMNKRIAGMARRPTHTDVAVRFWADYHYIISHSTNYPTTKPTLQPLT